MTAQYPIGSLSGFTRRTSAPMPRFWTVSVMGLCGRPPLERLPNPVLEPRAAPPTSRRPALAPASARDAQSQDVSALARTAPSQVNQAEDSGNAVLPAKTRIVRRARTSQHAIATEESSAGAQWPSSSEAATAQVKANRFAATS